MHGQAQLIACVMLVESIIYTVREASLAALESHDDTGAKVLPKVDRRTQLADSGSRLVSCGT